MDVKYRITAIIWRPIVSIYTYLIHHLLQNNINNIANNIYIYIYHHHILRILYRIYLVKLLLLLVLVIHQRKAMVLVQRPPYCLQDVVQKLYLYQMWILMQIQLQIVFYKKVMRYVVDIYIINNHNRILFHPLQTNLYPIYK